MSRSYIFVVMKFTAENIYHIYNQGNNRQLIFLDDEDYTIFLKLTNSLIKPNAEIFAWCLMPNHFHFLVYATEKSIIPLQQGGLIIDSLTNGVRKLLSGYARIFNQKYQRTGSLFRQKTKAKNISEAEVILKNSLSLRDYCRAAFWYIHQNPVVAGLSKHPEDWPWSSYRDYAALRHGKLINKEFAMQYCGFSNLDFKAEKPFNSDLSLTDLDL